MQIIITTRLLDGLFNNNSSINRLYWAVIVTHDLI